MKLKCNKHPHYKINKKPPYECVECLSLYLKFKGTRKPIAPPTKVMKSKKNYSRKKLKKELMDG